MSIFRSYFSKNNTLISRNRTNNSQNPVTEISYGTTNADVSRFIFDVDLQPLINKINSGEISQDSIQSHKLVLTNTIASRPNLIGDTIPISDVRRAASFTLEFFNIDQEWDEGNGYDFVYQDEQFPLIPQQASNWFDRKTGISWTYEGAYTGIVGTGLTTNVLFGAQDFPKGNENIEIDLTDYFNQRIASGNTIDYSTFDTGYTATTLGVSYGIGIKHTDEIESIQDIERRGVAFFAKNTNTFYEPYIETTYTQEIQDDRNFFYMDNDNDLFFTYVKSGQLSNVTINSVEIYDYNNILIETIPSSGVTNVRTGYYKITVSVSSNDYPDAVIFNDRWNITDNGVDKVFNKYFYLQQENNELNNRFNPDNYSVNLIGIKENELIKEGSERSMILDIRQLYTNQDTNRPLNLKYRIYIKQNRQNFIDVIEATDVDRLGNQYIINLDMSWFIVQDYYLEISIVDREINYPVLTRKFQIIS